MRRRTWPIEVRDDRCDRWFDVIRCGRVHIEKASSSDPEFAHQGASLVEHRETY